MISKISPPSSYLNRMKSLIPKNKEIYLLIFILLILFITNYTYLDSKVTHFLNQEQTVIHVTRVIDGDTVKINGTSNSIRFLGMNAPEISKKEEYSQEAKTFVEKAVKNKTIILAYGPEKKGRYGRTLAYLIVGGKNINLEEVRDGLANFYFPSGRTRRFNEFKTAWEECIKDKINLCAPSVNLCSKCIKLKKLDYEGETVNLYNSCNKSCDLTGWDIKDEGRNHFKFSSFILEPKNSVIIKDSKYNRKDSSNYLYWKVKQNVWTNTGDTFFLRDAEGKLVLWYNY